MNKYVDFFKNPKDLIIWGTGRSATFAFDSLIKNGYKVKGFCDNNESKQNTIMCNCKIISPTQLEDMKENVKVIIASVWYYSIKEQLEEMGITDLLEFDYDPVIKHYYGIHLAMLGKVCEKFEDVYTNQNKISEVINFLADEKSKDVYVDVGVFDGGSIYNFIKFAGINNIKQIYGFEPDRENYKNTMNILKRFPKQFVEKIKLLDLALGKEKSIVNFSGLGTSESGFCENGGYTVEVNSLDNLFYDEKITCIKMDIEGAEIEALLGAENIIKKYKPKLAICIYHEPDHLWKIPLMIKEMVPEYSIYIRHNSSIGDAETVCYAQI